jgi:hypothetical protein
MSQIYANPRPLKGIYTDFSPPNLLLGTLGIPIGTLVKQVDSQIYGLRARPIASDFAPPNTILGTFVVPKAPFVPPPTSDNAQHVKARWSSTDFAPPILLGRFLGPSPVRSFDTAGDAWSIGKASRPGVYSDFTPPNILLISPPPLRGPYVAVETGIEITRRAVYKAFDPPNITLNTIALVGAGQSFRGRTDEIAVRPRSIPTDFVAPNFITTTAALQIQVPFQPPDFPTSTRRPPVVNDFQTPNLLASTFGIFLGNPPKTFPDPYVAPFRKPGVYNDTQQANFLTGPSSVLVGPPLSALDDCLQAWKSKSLPADFNAPNTITGILTAAAPPQPPSPITVPQPGLQALPYTFTDPQTAYRRISEVINQMLQGRATAVGRYQAAFGSGPVQYAGPSGQLAGSDNLIFGLNLPNPAGIPGAALLAGSGGGNGQNVTFWFITDQAFDTLSPGNDIYHTAGETQPGSAARGGNWTVIAGASDEGQGGQVTIQGGTSVTGPAGITIVQGGNNTFGNLPAGDVFIIGGQEGSQGASVHLIATSLNGISGFIRHRVNSTIRWDEYPGDGTWFFYDGSGFGSDGAPVISKGPGQPVGFATDGATGTFTSQDGKVITVKQGRITGIH